MLKYSSFILLVAVAICWSRTDARRQPLKRSLALSHYKRAFALAARYAAPFKALAKRETEPVEDSSEELTDEMAKQLLVAFLIMSVDDSAEQNTLGDKLKETLDKNWDSLDDFGNEVLKVYEEVTGKKLSEPGDAVA